MDSEQAPNPTQQTAQVQSGINEDTKTLITILLLVLVYPVGLVLMFVWMKWKWWIKVLVLLPLVPFVLIFAGLIAGVVLIAMNPKAQIEKSQCISYCQQYNVSGNCVSACANNEITVPDDFLTQ